jgi:hypothetical protein
MSQKRRPTHADAYAEALRQMTLSYERLVLALSILRQLDDLDDPEFSLDRICLRIAETVAFGLAAEHCHLWLLDPTGGESRLMACCSPFLSDGQAPDDTAVSEIGRPGAIWLPRLPGQANRSGSRMTPPSPTTRH